MTERIYAPWRIEYILGEEKEPGCVFCNGAESSEDEKRLIVHRAEGAFTIMNKYPYTNGHVLVCPYRHVSDIAELDSDENRLVLEEVLRAIAVLRDVMRPTGLNVGINLGVDAGAGIEEHLHYHVVPRWRGDTNIMAVLADVKVIPEHFESTSRKLRAGFNRLFPETDRKVEKCD
jgi:ATP adenylyltransferase